MLFPNHSRILLGSSIAFLSLATLVSYTPRARAIDITFDYFYDDPANGGNNFFGSDGSPQRARLREAAAYFENNINDSLPELNPGAGETFTIDFMNPNDTTGTRISRSDRTIAQDEILIFVGSDELGFNGSGEPILGLGEKSASSIDNAGSTLFNAYTTRQAEASQWGGAISFDIESGSNSTDWYFGSDIGSIGTTQADFLSTAIHEIAHVMGFGTSDNWNNLVSGTNFTGTTSSTIFGSDVPLDAPNIHWLDGTESNVKGVLALQETAMDPSIDDGTRKLLTDLDYAGLQDIGWEVNSSVYSSSVPFEFSPSLGIFFVAGMFGTKKVLDARKGTK